MNSFSRCALRFRKFLVSLYIAANYGHTATVSKLLQHGADKSIRGSQNETPLEAAQRKNHAAVITLLA